MSRPTNTGDPFTGGTKLRVGEKRAIRRDWELERGLKIADEYEFPTVHFNEFMGVSERRTRAMLSGRETIQGRRIA